MSYDFTASAAYYRQQPSCVPPSCAPAPVPPPTTNMAPPPPPIPAPSPTTCTFGPMVPPLAPCQPPIPSPICITGQFGPNIGGGYGSATPASFDASYSYGPYGMRSFEQQTGYPPLQPPQIIGVPWPFRAFDDTLKSLVGGYNFMSPPGQPQQFSGADSNIQFWTTEGPDAWPGRGEAFEQNTQQLMPDQNYPYIFRGMDQIPGAPPIPYPPNITMNPPPTDMGSLIFDAFLIAAGIVVGVVAVGYVAKGGKLKFPKL